MKRSRAVDEYGCELTPEEEKEVDQMAQDITEKIFGEKSHGTNVPEQKSVPRMPNKAADEKGADQAAAVSVKKRPGRPKRIHQDEAKSAQNEVTVHEDPQREVLVIPDEVIKAVSEKITVITRTIESYEEQIEELKSDCQRNIELFEGYKKESQDKLMILKGFLEGAGHGQG